MRETGVFGRIGVETREMSDSDSDPFRPRPLSTGEVVDLKNQVVAFEHTALILGLHALEDSPETNSQAVIGLYVGFRGGVLVWDLYPDERRGVVLPEIDRLVHAFDSIRGQFAMTRRGTYTLLTGFALIFTSLSIALAATPVDPFVDILPVWGYTIAGSGAAWFVGG